MTLSHYTNKVDIQTSFTAYSVSQREECKHVNYDVIVQLVDVIIQLADVIGHITRVSINCW